MPLRVVGMDLSLLHGAVVALDEAGGCEFWYYTERAGTAERHKNASRIPPIILKQELHLRNVLRLVWVRAWLKTVLRISAPFAVALEDYAYAADQGSHQLGELGGVARLSCWDLKVRLRLHSPGTIKMFGADNGSADKGAVKDGVRRKWGADFDRYDAPAKPGAKKQDTSISEDLTDAYVLARMVLAEARIRAGTMMLSELGSDKERQAFLRTTPTYPINVLGREWVALPADAEPLLQEVG